MKEVIENEIFTFRMNNGKRIKVKISFGVLEVVNEHPNQSTLEDFGMVMKND